MLSLAEQVMYDLDNLKIRLQNFISEGRLPTEQEEIELMAMLCFLKSTRQSVLPKASLQVEVPVWCNN